MKFLLGLLCVFVAYSQVNNQICPIKTKDINVVKTLPRFGAKGQLGISQNWADYPFLVCTGPPDNRSCETNSDISPSNSDFKDYFVSLLFYPGFGIFMFVVTLLSGIGLFVGRYLCCCCVKGGCCGKTYPTRKTTCCGFGGIWGYVPIKNADGTPEFGYPTLWRWVTRGYMALFVFFLFLWIGLGHFEGNEGLTESMVSVAAAATPISDTIIGAAPIVGSFLANLMGDAFVVLLRDVNQTVNEAVDLDLAFDNVNCVLDAVDDFPNITEVQQFVNDSVAQLTDTTDLLYATNNATADLRESVNRINQSIDDLRVTTMDLTGEINASLANISESLEASEEFGFIQDSILNDTNGLETIISDANALHDNLPPSADITAVTDNSEPASIPQYLSGTQSVFNTTLLRDRLISLLDTYNRIPNLDTTADNMELFNQNIETIKDQDMINTFSAQVEETRYALEHIIDDSYTQIINASIQNILTQVRNVSWDGLYDVLELVNQTLNNNTVLNEFQQKLEAITNLSSIIPCVQSLLTQVTGINDTLLVFPESIQDSLDQLIEFNQTLLDIDEQVKNFSNMIQDYIDNSLNVNLSDYKRQIDEMKDQTNAQADAVDTNEIIDRLKNATQAANLTEFDQIQADLMDLNNTIQNASIDQDLIDSYRLLQDQLDDLRGRLRRGISDLAFYLYGECSSDPTQPCEDVAGTNCPGGGGCSFAATMRCKIEETNIWPVSCSYGVADNSGDCPFPDDYCLNDPMFWGALAGALDLSASIPDDTETLDNLNELNNTLIRNLRSGFEQQIQDAQDSIQEVSTTSLLDEIDELTSALDTFDIDNMTAQFDDLLQQTQDLDLTELYDEIDSLNETFAEIDDKKAELTKVRDLVNILDKLLFERLPNYLDIIDDIEEYGKNGGGLANELLVLARDVVDDLIQLLNNQTFFDPIDFNATEETETVRDVLTLFSDPKYTDNGPWNFFYSAIDKIENKTRVIIPPRGKGHQVWKWANGTKYYSFNDPTNPNDTLLCLTMDCIENTIDYYNNQPISKLLKEADVSLPGAAGIGNLDASRTDLVSAPYLVPFFTAIFAAISCLLIFPGALPDGIATLFASITACLSFSCMPFIFLFAGTFFILPIIGGDACLSVENMGYQYLHGMGDSTCDKFSGNGTLRACQFDVGNQTDIDSPHFSFILDIERTYTQLLGGCSGTDPLFPIYNALRNAIQEQIPYQVDRQISELNETSDGLQLKQPLVDAFSKFGHNLANVSSDFVTDVSGLLGCSNAHKVYSTAKNAFCCDVMTAMYWMTASWYLIGWSMLLCGCGAGLLGRKRFPYALWGDEYTRDRQMMMNGDFDFAEARSGPVAEESGEIALDDMGQGEGHDQIQGQSVEGDQEQVVAPQHHIQLADPSHEFVAADQLDHGAMSTDEFDREMGRVE